MNKILAGLAAVMTWVIAQKEKFTAVSKQVSDRDKIIAERDAEIERLLKLLETENADDAKLEAEVKEARERQTAAEARTAELEKQRLEIEEGVKTAEAEADKLLAEINDDPDVPITVADGVVTAAEAPREFKPPVPKGAE